MYKCVWICQTKSILFYRKTSCALLGYHYFTLVDCYWNPGSVALSSEVVQRHTNLIKNSVALGSNASFAVDLLIQYVLQNPVPGTEQAAFSCFFFANTISRMLDDFGKCHWGAHTSLPSDRRERSRRWAAKCQGDLRVPAALKLHPPSQRLFHIFADNERIVKMAVEMGDCSDLVISKTSWKSEKLKVL